MPRLPLLYIRITFSLCRLFCFELFASGASAVLSHLAALKLGVVVGVGLTTLRGFVVGWLRCVTVLLCVGLYVYSFVGGCVSLHLA